MTTLDGMTRTDARPARSPWLTAARVVMGVFGAQLLAGAVYFTFFASPAEGGVVSAFDWFVAVWAIVAAAGLLVTAMVPFSSAPRRIEAAWWVLGVHALWGVVKVAAYDEMPVSGIVLGVDVVIGLLLWRAARVAPADPAVD